MTRTRSQAGKLARAKGAQFERDVVNAFKAVWPEARRNLSQTRTARREGADVLGVPFWAELKCGKRIDLDEALAQAERDALGMTFATGSSAPLVAQLRCIVIAKRDRHAPIVYGRASVVCGAASASLRVSCLLEDWLLEQAQ